MGLGKALAGIATAVAGLFSGSPQGQPVDTGTDYVKHQASTERDRQRRESDRSSAASSAEDRSGKQG